MEFSLEYQASLLPPTVKIFLQFSFLSVIKKTIYATSWLTIISSELELYSTVDKITIRLIFQVDLEVGYHIKACIVLYR